MPHTLVSESETAAANGDIEFQSSRDTQLIVATITILVFGVLCENYLDPSQTGRICAIVSYLLGAVFLLSSGLKYSITFRKQCEEMEVQWRLFGFRLFGHSYSFGDLDVCAPILITSATPRSQSFNVAQQWVVQVGDFRYALKLKDNFTFDDSGIDAVRRHLGLGKIEQSSIRHE